MTAPHNLVRDGKIVDLRHFAAPPPPSPAGAWLPRREQVAPEAAWAYDQVVSIGDVAVTVGWQLKPLEQLRDACVALVREKRWAIETGGIEVPGAPAPVRTDEVSQSKVMGALYLLDSDPTLEGVDWEAQPEAWVTVEREPMKAIGIAVGRHIQRCFTCSKYLCVTGRALPSPEAAIEFHWALSAAVTLADYETLALEYGAPE